LSPVGIMVAAHGRVIGGAALAFGLLAAPLAHAGENAAVVSITRSPNIAVVRIGGLKLSDAATAGAVTAGNGGGHVRLGIDGGNGLVTVSRAADLVGQPVDLVQYARMRAAMLAAASSPGRGEMPTGSPLNAAMLTSGFGMRRHPMFGGYRPHMGVDLAAPLGTPIFAPSSGVVGRADWAGGYGLLVSLEHGKGVQSRYGHLSRLNVSAGQHVRKGDLIGYVGSTGRSTGPHLHYEVRVNGQAVKPDLHGAGK
jgi:Peptidase family M23